MYSYVARAVVGFGCVAVLSACPAGAPQERGHSNGDGTRFASTGGAGGAGMGGGPGGNGGAAGASGMGAGSGGNEPVGGNAGGAGGDFVPHEQRMFDADRTNLNRNKVTAGQLCDRLSTIQCAGEAFCCDFPGRDRATCKEEMLMGCRVELFLDSVSMAPETGFDAPAAEAAFTEFERLASECDPAIARWAIAIDGLRGIMKGTVAQDAECTPADFSLSSPPNKEQGAVALVSCRDGATHACMPGLTRWTCKARAAAGASCFTDANCKDGLYCDNPDLNLTANACVARKPGGASCALPNECESLACKDGTCADQGDMQAAYCLR